MTMVSHARYTHMVESIDITNTELEEVNTVPTTYLPYLPLLYFVPYFLAMLDKRWTYIPVSCSCSVLDSCAICSAIGTVGTLLRHLLYYQLLPTVAAKLFVLINLYNSRYACC